MENYQHVLLAIDFYEHGPIVAAKAKSIINQYQSTLSIIHVVDNLPFADSIYDSFPPVTIDLTAAIMRLAKNKLARVAKQLNVPEQNTYLEIGSPKTEIIRIADKIMADLIIVGSHGRHGIALLLGSTANGVLHHAKCDVLAVRLHDNP